MIKISEKQLKCLKVLAEEYHGEWGDGETYYTFAPVMRATKLTRREVRLAIRALARKGLAKYCKGLWGDDGPAGAGYACTEDGKKFLDSMVVSV